MRWDEAPTADQVAAAPPPKSKMRWQDAPTADEPLPGQASTAGKVVQGLRDPIDAGAQILSHVIPESVTDALDYLPAKLRNSDSPLLQTVGESFFADPRAKATDARIQATEKQYQQARVDEQPQTLSGLVTGKKPEPGIDWSRLVGNILSPVNLAVGARLPTATSVPGRVGAAAGTGAAFGALSPVNDGGDFVTEKAKQVATGAVLGPATQLVGEAAARVVSPQTRDSVLKLIKEGVTPTPGQILGGRWQVLEDKLTSVTLLGDAIASSRKTGLDELNMAAYKRVLEPIGGKMPQGVGREAVADIREQISDAYNKLLPKVQFKADNQFSQDIQTIRTMAEQLPPEQAARFERVLKNQVIGKMTPQGNMAGATLKAIESDVGSLASGLKRDASFDNRTLGAALSEVQAAIRSNLERSNPDYAAELKAANTAWANFKRVQNAAGRQGSETGKFTPGQLSAAVRQLDRSKDKRAFSEGDALMQDLSDAGKDVLAQKYPDSGTAARAMLGWLTGSAATGGAVVAPGIGVPAVAGAALGIAPYLPGGRSLAAMALARRPQGAEGVANAVRRIAPAASPAFIGLFKP